MNKTVIALFALLAIASAVNTDQCVGAVTTSGSEAAGTPRGLCKTCSAQGTGCTACNDGVQATADTTTDKVCKCNANYVVTGAADANTNGATCTLTATCSGTSMCKTNCATTAADSDCVPAGTTKECKAGAKVVEKSPVSTSAYTCTKNALTATQCAGTDTLATDETATAECINTDTTKQLCKTGYFKADSTAAGKVTGQYKCTACISNCGTCADATTCTTCNAGYFLATDKKACTACGTNCTACDNDTSCTTCKETTQKWNTEKKACLSAFKTGAGLTLGSVVAVALFSLLF